MAVLSSFEALTPEWLTLTLRENGCLPYGSVTRITATRTSHQASLNYFLAIEYSPDAPLATAPATLFFKVSRPERLPLTASEVEYYTKILKQTPYKIAPRCYAAEHDPVTGAYHILLEDVSMTHFVLPYQFPPTPEHGIAMGKVLARLHAHWWENPDLAHVSDLPTEAVIRRYTDTCLATLPDMLRYCGTRLTADQHHLVEEIATQYPRWMIKRVAQTPNHLTLIHGDAHNGNFLLPRGDNADNQKAEPYLIDRQPFDWSLTCWLGVSDLTYMMIHWWHPSYREPIEDSILRAYHRELLTHGVTNYPWEQLWDDYRLCAIQSLYVSLAWCLNEGTEKFASMWYSKLMFTLDAVAYLQSADLLRKMV